MPGPYRPINFYQTVIQGREEEINRGVPILILQENELTSQDVDIFRVFDHVQPLGISPGFSVNGRLVALAIADAEACRIIEFVQPKGRKPNSQPVSQANEAGRLLLQEKVVCREIGDLFAFDMAPLAMALYNDLGVRLTNAIDIQSNFSPTDRKPLNAITGALGESVKLSLDNIRDIFHNPIYDPDDNTRHKDLAHRAWISQFLASFGNGITQFSNAKKINTKNLSPEMLALVSKVSRDSTRLDQLKPVQTSHQITQDYASKETIQVKATHFNNRLRSDRRVAMTLNNHAGSFTVPAMVGEVAGRRTDINTSGDSVNFSNKDVMAIVSIGRDDPTTAEAKRAATVLQVLQGQYQLLDDSPWISNIWFSALSDTMTWPFDWKEVGPAAIHNPKFKPKRQLNNSQQAAVNSMLSYSNKDRLTLVQGPPGTGKTSVISMFVQFGVYLFSRTGIWLVAQSNVAVKNIAEKLANDGFQQWKLLVSKDFHFDWHEHLYGADISRNIIQSTRFKEVNKMEFKDTKVVLCTLSTLSNRHMSKFTRWVPLETLVVDEASQIEIGDYISVFSSFKSSLRKVCFIGDNKQLPPYGQEDLQDLQSIFEVAHLEQQVRFLDTQYRMPPQIGDIISEAVYDSKLKSNPLHPIKDTTTACYFVDVAIGKEKFTSERSYMNEQECQVVLLLAQKLQEQNKSYRIITPYEGQRSLIEDSMKKAELLWADKCFNVDSFQGNEDDYIVISLVRTREIGFLKNLRRTNVMLTRCKKGMFIISNKQFLLGAGSETLVATLLAKAGNPWLAIADIENDNF